MEKESIEYILGEISGELKSIRSSQIQTNSRIDQAFHSLENNVLKSDSCRRMVIEHETKLCDLREEIANKSNWKASIVGGFIVGIPTCVISIISLIH